MSPRKSKSKIRPALTVARFLAKSKRSRKKTKAVFTNGCFDLLHPGHVKYLEKARSKGDLLIVALNSDASVQAIKGPTRPLNPLQDRMEVIAALECVDFVTWFEEDTPLLVITKIKPDVLVKGGDWKPDQIVGGAEVRSWGGKVLSLPYIEGKSTTRIVEKAQFGK